MARRVSALALLLVAPCAFALLQPFAPVRTHAAVSMSRPALVMRADEHSGPVTPAKAQRSFLRRNLDRVGTALAIGMASVMMRAPPAFAARKAVVAPTRPQPVKINGLQKAGMVITVAGVIYVGGHLATEAEFAEEKKRVAKEVKKMEKMKKEFTDIDEGVGTDEDLMAALNKRKSELANSTATDSEGNPLEGGEEGG
eukprot:CAMPEP_0118828560 /NCGR_PEP_ID=MMETSP1162-20130426/18980_1 /TAXON_ID=33656 /ORGANISM="Phaeocystis Sp, Strain CCMP2710" /LENGTH=197 /DNA_ID=CAMNT_0006759581 /DNA_START=13 /DNA_END=602 /DNA_ORIENTATION=+